MVSVIIPVYNVEKYLRECLDSVTGQTYRNLEIILVDDGSTDKSGAICDEYAENDSRITVLHQPNCGQAAARNNGFTLATGKYICFIDSDDMLDKNAAESLVSFIEREKAELVCYDGKSFFEDFEDKDYYEELSRSRHFRTEKGALFLTEQLKNQAFLSCPYLHLFRRDFLEKIHFRFPDIHMHEDELIMPVVYVKAKKIAHLHKTLYMRRLRAGSVMSDKDTSLSIECLAVCVSRYVKELKKYPPDSDESIALTLMINFVSSIMMHKYALLSRSERKKALPAVRCTAKRVSALPAKNFLKVRIKLSYPGAFCLSRQVLLPVKKLLCRF